LSDRRASQKSSGWNTSSPGSKPRNASSKPGHFFSITVQAKPDEKILFAISARISAKDSM
jgi:hypothetical protein